MQLEPVLVQRRMSKSIAKKTKVKVKRSKEEEQLVQQRKESLQVELPKYIEDLYKNQESSVKLDRIKKHL